MTPFITASLGNIRKEIILEAAAAHQADLGWADLTLEAIGLKTGISPDVVHTLFPARETLRLTVVEKQMNDAFDSVRHCTHTARTLAGKIDAFIGTRNAALRQYASLRELAGSGVTGISMSAYHALRKSFDLRQQQIVYDLLRFGVASGRLRVIEDAYLHEIAGIIVSALRGVEMSMPRAGMQPGVGNYSRIILDMIVNGIKSDTGSLTGGQR